MPLSLTRILVKLLDSLAVSKVIDAPLARLSLFSGVITTRLYVVAFTHISHQMIALMLFNEFIFHR